jgi:hypothetical protein
LQWGSSKGLYLDKGFNVKFLYKSKKYNIPNFAIGLDDFAGTGLFSREYIVSTYDLEKFKISLGMGWGKLAGNNGRKNPLGYLANRFNSRGIQSSNYNLGGSLAYDQWFSGPASFFGGIELFVPKLNGAKIKLEYDPSNYIGENATGLSPFNIGASEIIRNQDSNFNIGLSYKINKYVTLDTSYIKGNTLNLSINISRTFDKKLSRKPDFDPSIKKSNDANKSMISFYEDLLHNINNNNLLLQTASLDDKKLNVSIQASNHRNAIRSSSYSSFIAKKVLDDHEIDTTSINVSHINAGIELNQIKYITDHIGNDRTSIEQIKRTTVIKAGEMKFKNHDFQPIVNFPAIFSSIDPVVVSHVGSPQRVFYGGLSLNNLNEIQFSRNLLFVSEIRYAVFNNFDDITSIPDSLLPHVRTDIVRYLQTSDLQIPRMQLDYFWSPFKNIYAKVSGGILEPMYGGMGFEALYKPFGKNYSIAIESYLVKKRDFDQRFAFRNYKTSTGHISIASKHPLGIDSVISYGRYLAKDDGITVDLSRTTNSGFKAGIYFSITDVPTELFGEGSFDKGFYFQIPLDLFTNSYSGKSSNFKLSPLTRDGGAKLQQGNFLRDMIHNSSLYQINQGWDGYLN